jgi:hypothetical protein
MVIDAVGLGTGLYADAVVCEELQNSWNCSPRSSATRFVYAFVLIIIEGAHAG